MPIADSPDGQARISAFRESLQGLGWIAGHNIRIDIRWAGGDAERIRAYSAEFARQALDVILVNGTQAATILLRDVHNVPVVFVQVSDPLNQEAVFGKYTSAQGHRASDLEGGLPLQF